jgi:DNA invertase Pin-like site-specific DNA recombinase
MLIGYARVSTREQNLDLQLDALKNAGCKPDYVFTDKISTSKPNSDRAGLEGTMSHLRKGDTLVIWRLDRLGRTLKELIDLVNDLNRRGVGFKSCMENLDTTTPGGMLIFHIFGALAEFERAVIKERTNAGLQAARARGRLGGRPKLQTLDPKKIALAKKLYAERNMLVKEICNTLHIGKSTLYRYVGASQDKK